MYRVKWIARISIRFIDLQLAEEGHLAKALGKLGYIEVAEVKLHNILVDAAYSLAVSTGNRTVIAHGSVYVTERKVPHCCRDAPKYGEGDQRTEMNLFHRLLFSAFSPSSIFPNSHSLTF